MSKMAMCACCLILSAYGQSVVITGSLINGSGGRHVVRDAAGVLWCAYVREVNTGGVITRPVTIASSADNGGTWTVSPFVVNDPTSGLNMPNGANGVNMAIDSTGVLHITWEAYYYPTYFQCYYRNYHPSTLAAGAVLNLSSLLGATTASRSDAAEIAVDARDIVWVMAPTPTNWVTRLLFSNQPSAAGNTFASAGNLQGSASSQAPRMVIDATGLVHTFCYRNIGMGNYEHRVYSPTMGWSATTVLGNTTAPGDYYGEAAADALGNVHALIFKDSQVGQTATWGLRYRMWNPATGWNSEIPVADIPSSLYTGVLYYRCAALAVDEGSGMVSLVMRDLAAGGQLRLLVKGLLDPSFVSLSDLTAPSMTAHEYFVPAMRGRLWPASDRTGSTPDVTWRQGTSIANYTLNFQRAVVPVATSTFLAEAPLFPGTSTLVRVKAPTQGGLPFVSAFAFSPAPGIPLADGRVIPVAMDGLFFMSIDPLNGVFLSTTGILDSTGTGFVGIALPPLPILSGVNFTGTAVTLDPLALSGVGSIAAAPFLHIF